MKVNLYKCPVCGDSYGMLETAKGAKHPVTCLCDKVHTKAVKFLFGIVGIAFTFLVMIQVEKNVHMLKKVVDTLKSIW